MTLKNSDFQNIFVCPITKKSLRRSDNKYICDANGLTYEIKSGVPVFMTGTDTDTLSEFWDSGWSNRHNYGDHSFHKKNSEEYRNIVEEKISDARCRNTPMMSANPVKEDIVLNIGCGFDESSQLTVLGAKKYIGIDYSYFAAKASLEAMKKLKSEGITAQANAEFLPIKGDSVDLVYSSGVLHHTYNTKKAIEEVFRVLKHEGRAVIGLYSKFSPKFIVARIIGSFRSVLSRKKMSWYSQTETSWKTDSNLEPFTSTYSKKEILNLFNNKKCSDIELRVTGFNWGDVIPIFGKYFAKTALGLSSANYLSSRFGSMWVITFKKIDQ